VLTTIAGGIIRTGIDAGSTADLCGSLSHSSVYSTV
jgi:hypothetical protein